MKKSSMLIIHFAIYHLWKLKKKSALSALKRADNVLTESDGFILSDIHWTSVITHS